MGKRKSRRDSYLSFFCIILHAPLANLGAGTTFIKQVVAIRIQHGKYSDSIKHENGPGSFVCCLK